MTINMQVVVASRNPVKISATQHAFATQFPDAAIEIIPVDVDSGAGDQPISDEATRLGARTRARRAKHKSPGAQFWVGLEGGIEELDGQLMAFAWMAIEGPADTVSEARSATLPLPPAIKALVDGGVELGEANDRVFATLNSKQGGGAYGLLTKGLYTRESIYTQTLIIALVPFVNALYLQAVAPKPG
jgi:inosine/xanthosine triphosphatase